jgi:hypothetical protein
MASQSLNFIVVFYPIRGIQSMKAEYDFSKGERGKFYNPKTVFNLPIYLEKNVDDSIRKLADERYKLKLRRIRK